MTDKKCFAAFNAIVLTNVRGLKENVITPSRHLLVQTEKSL